MIKIEKTEAFAAWFRRLRDLAGRVRIEARILRLGLGNPGQRRVLHGGIVELKVDYGPGYRVYYTHRKGRVVLLLCGGDKSSQQRDILMARTLAAGLEE